MEVGSEKNKMAECLRMLFGSNRGIGHAVMICDSNMGMDSDGIEHYSLFGPYLFPRPSMPDMGMPGNISKSKMP